MAGTGVFLVLFVIAHMVGNLQMFAGPEAINSYAAMLKSLPGPLWGARIGLLVFFLIHVVVSVQLHRENKAARSTEYVNQKTIQASLPSRTMLLAGSIVGLYAVGHLLHFTLGVLLPENFHLKDIKGRHDVYSMVVLGFQHPAVSILYIGAMLSLWSHLSHGISSVFQTFGLRGSLNRCWIDKAGPLLSTIIVLGYISIPIGVLLGIIALPPGVQ